MNRYSDVFINEGIDGAKVVSVCDKDSSLVKRGQELDAQPFNSVSKMFYQSNFDLTIILSSSGMTMIILNMLRKWKSYIN